jgi:hypothetical protein
MHYGIIRFGTILAVYNKRGNQHWPIEGANGEEVYLRYAPAGFKFEGDYHPMPNDRRKYGMELI